MKFQKTYSAIAATILVAILSWPSFGATTLLPPGSQCFTDANGAVASGSINMFYPSTTTPKPTWKDSNQVTLNSQPIQLDNNGCAVIYGVGSYRQQLYDGPVVLGVTTGNLLFDQLTTDTSAYNSTFWAGLAAGTPNVITIVDTGFNATDGTVINFTALATNTGATTINPSSFGAIPVLKDTTAGPVSLVGGEIVQNNPISVIYRSSDASFHLLNTAIPTASGSTAPMCGAVAYSATNNAISANSSIDMSAGQVITANSSGLVVNRTSVNGTVNITTGTTVSTAGGMDGESPGASAWVYLWFIDNGSSSGVLASAASGNGLTPNLPAGYTYKCRMGAAWVDSGGNLFRIIQKGNQSQWVVTSATNTAALPVMASGTHLAYTAVPVSSFAPPTAKTITTVLNAGSIDAILILVAPNGNYGNPTAITNPPPCGLNNGNASNGSSMSCEIILESTSVYWLTNNANSILFSFGWKDAVNAQ